jgi:hypothetical protein
MERRGEELWVCFEGYLDGESGLASARAVADVLEASSTAVGLVLDVGAMSGYAPEARRAWQETLAPHHTKLRHARTRGASTLVRMGATVVGLFLGLSVHHE